MVISAGREFTSARLLLRWRRNVVYDTSYWWLIPACIITRTVSRAGASLSNPPPQGCGLGLETVSRRTNVSSWSCQPLGLGHLRLVPKTKLYCYGASALTVSCWACRSRRTQCKRALDVVSLCCIVTLYYIT